jgi:Fe-S-cluster containining protein
MRFPCIKCGLCCQSIKNVHFLAEYDNGNGVCRYLVDNICSIYNERPEICNVEQMYYLYFKKSMNENEFILANLNSCLQLAKEKRDLPCCKRLQEALSLYKNQELYKK